MENATILQIRHAIESEDYTTATALWNTYAGWLSEEMAAGRLTESAWRETSELMMWSGIVLRCARAQAGDWLNMLQVTTIYGSTTPCQLPRFRIAG